MERAAAPASADGSGGGGGSAGVEATVDATTGETRYGLGLTAGTRGELEGAHFVVDKVTMNARREPRKTLPMHVLMERMRRQQSEKWGGNGDSDSDDLDPASHEEEVPVVSVGDVWEVPEEGTLNLVVEYAPARPKVRGHNSPEAAVALDPPMWQRVRDLVW